MSHYLNIHDVIDARRQAALQGKGEGPRVFVVGPTGAAAEAGLAGPAGQRGRPAAAAAAAAGLACVACPAERCVPPAPSLPPPVDQPTLADVGKSSLCKILLNYAVRAGWAPTFADLVRLAGGRAGGGPQHLCAHLRVGSGTAGQPMHAR